MAFDSLSQKITLALRNITGKNKLTEKNMDKMLKEVRTALLEADVNYSVTKQFIEDIKNESVGLKITDGLDPASEVVKIVHNKIVEVLGEKESEVSFQMNGITTIMIVGLQGTGKTTSAGKIAKYLKEKNNRKVLLVAADVKRPGAIEQLQALGQKVEVEVFTLGMDVDVITTVKKANAYAKSNSFDTVIIDTAGRLSIDEELMKELEDIKKLVKPQEILLTVDALTGQGVVDTAKTFYDKVGVTGLIVSKFDSDTRGGGVFSVRAITGVPVMYVGTGEKMEDLELFHPDRMASRILGMGDVMTLIEQAQEKMDLKASEDSAKRMMNGQFTLDDMLIQFKQVRKMGSLSGLMRMLPGMGNYAAQLNDADVEKKMKYQEAIIYSMTPAERANPSALRGTHKKRIAKGSGTTVDQVNQVINAYERTKKQMTSMNSLLKNKQFMDAFSKQ